ncbi:MaoC/PaaZ C-terminal domain-containing protein [Candidatus Poriferisocius sp.]|uniref:MaoC/PaaZ C-terminal domain-containing protein n=1 Tax=Candidatus Poriferisocius sp. TaxID=3101276 RepID=UPI003B525BF8
MTAIPSPSVGDELPRLAIEAVDAEKMKTMAALLADSNPIHWDVATVKELGMGDQPVNQGPNNLGYVMNMLGDWAGGAERIQQIRVRFLDNVFAGDRLEAGGTITAVGDDGTVDCDVWLARDGTHPVLAGTATVSMA